MRLELHELRGTSGRIARCQDKGVFTRFTLYGACFAPTTVGAIERRLFFSRAETDARFPSSRFNEIPRQGMSRSETFACHEGMGVKGGTRRMETYVSAILLLTRCRSPLVLMAFAMPACLFARGLKLPSLSNATEMTWKGGAFAAKGLQSCCIIRQGDMGACFAQTSVAARVARKRDARPLFRVRSFGASMRLISLFLVIDRLPPIFSAARKDRACRSGARRFLSSSSSLARSLVLFPRPSWPTFTRLPSPLCSLHTSRGCNLRLTERKPKGSDHVVTRSAHRVP